MTEPTPELIARLEADKRDAADRMTFEQRAWAGLGMYDLVAESIKTGLRFDHPDADEAEIHRMFLERMREVRERGVSE